MDRIRKALDIARAERAERTAGVDVLPSPRMRDPEEPAPPSLGIISYTKTRVYQPRSEVLEANRVIDPLRTDAAAHAFRMLRTQVLQRLDERGWRSIAVLSAGAHDGKTTTAVNLAINLASDNRHTVLLVDCDFKRPGIAASLDIEPELGLDDVLCGKARVEECLYHPEGFDRLVILPARARLGNSSEALSSSRGREFMTDLRARYPERIVVVDLPPILSADDAIAFLPMIECGLVVVAERHTSREDLLRCMELTRNTPIVGTVLNRSSSVVDAYG
jgi:Mrp family chromosome partitioning ATPase